MFNIPPTAKVIWRWGHGLVSSDRLEEPGIELRTPEYMVNGLFSISQQLLETSDMAGNHCHGMVHLFFDDGQSRERFPNCRISI